MHLRSAKKSRAKVSLYDPIGVDREGNEITLIDVLSSDPDVVPDQVSSTVDIESIKKELRNLGPKERQVLELRFGLTSQEKSTQREIAKMLGISRCYVSRIEKRAVVKLSKNLDY